MDEAPSSEVEEVATPTGLEPVISAVTGRRVNHYTKGPTTRDENPRSVPERFTSLIPNPGENGSTGIRSLVLRPSDRSPDSEPWDQYKAEHAHRKLLKHDAEQAHKVYAVIDSMMGNLHLSEGEALRMRATLREFFFDEVSSFSLDVSYGVLQ